MLRLYDSVKQFISKSGVPLTSGTVGVYLNGTDDLASVYADPNGLTPLSNPVSIDDDGRTLGLFVDERRVYRIEVRDSSGQLQWSVYPVSPLGGSGGGGGGVIPDIVSTDGTVKVESTVDGNRIVFDLSTDVEESVESLAWYRGDGGTVVEGDIYCPGKSGGTLEQGDAGVWLPGEQYFHVTYHVRAQKTSAEPYYDKVDLLLQLMDGNTFDVTNVCRRGVIVDWSMGLSQDFEFSCDVMTETASELQLRILSQDVQGGNFTLLDTEIHRVYSGAPYIPGGAGGGDYVGENGILVNNTTRKISADTGVLQEKLSAGENITIVGNTISATAAPQVNADWNAVSGVAQILNKPDLSQYVTDSEMETILSGYATSSELTYGLAGKQDTISDLQTIREGAAAGATAVQPATLNDYATTSAMNTALSGKQNVLTAGTGIDITGDTISCTQTFTQVNSDWDATSGVSQILHKPDLSVYATTQAMNTALAGKQDTISDLQTIREGAAAGATAVQPATLNDYATTSAMNTALAGKQDTISDLSDIRSGAALGATAVQPATLNDYATTSAMNTALAGKQDTISDLSDIRSGAAAGATAVQPATLNDYATTSAMNTALAGKQDVINDLSDIRSGAAAGATAVQPATLNDYVTTSALTTTLADYVTDTELGTILEGYATTTALSTGLAGKQDTISDLSDIRSGAALGATAVQPATLNDYATTSAMNTALAGKQDTLTAGTGITISGSTISNSAPNVKSDWNAAAGSDAEILNKPTIPVVPQMKELVAGDNISLTEGVSDVTVACTLTVGTVTV